MDASAVASPHPIGAVEWQGPIDSVGTARFDMQLMRSLQNWAGVEHHASFVMAHGGTRLLTAGASVQSHCELATAGHSAAQTAWEQPHRCGARGGGAVVFRIDPTTPCDGVFVCDGRDVFPTGSR